MTISIESSWILEIIFFNSVAILQFLLPVPFIGNSHEQRKEGGGEGGPCVVECSDFHTLIGLISKTIYTSVEGNS